jgi:uncharacterized Fe-S cluster protein YjdI
MKDITKEYTNGEVTIVWKPEQCIHSGNCFRGLNEVFNPQKLPWVSPDATTSQKIIDQVKRCPSGALSYYMNKSSDQVSETPSTPSPALVEPTPNGPLLVHGEIAVKVGDDTIRKSKVTAFCRCGGSANKPYCDGTHRRIDFKA